MSAKDAERFLLGDPEFAAVRGEFLCFVMISVEERMGQWRYAGSATTQAEVLAVLGRFMHTLCRGEPPEDFSYAGWAKDMDMDLESSWSYSSLPLEGAEERDHQVILFAEGGAPYDDAGLAILQVPSLAKTSFAGRVPQTERPAAWDQDPDQDEQDEE